MYHIITNIIIFYAGLDAKDLALYPEDKHLFRLAGLISKPEFRDVFLKLGLPCTTWDYIEDMAIVDPTVEQFLALCKWRELMRNKKAKPSFQELFNVLPSHVLCQVGTNHSQR